MKKTGIICGLVTVGLLMSSMAWAQDDEKRAGGERRGGGDQRGGERRGDQHGGGGGLEALGRMQGVGEDRLLTMILRSPEVAEELGIDEAEIAELREESYAYKLDLVDIEAAIKRIQLEHGQEWLKAEPNEETLLEQIQEAGELEIKKSKRRAKYLVILKKSFTPERMKQVREMMRERMQKRTEQFKREREGGGDREGGAERGGDAMRERRGRGDKEMVGRRDGEDRGWKGKEKKKDAGAKDED